MKSYSTVRLTKLFGRTPIGALTAVLQGTRRDVVTPQRRAMQARYVWNRHSDRHAPGKTQERHLRSKIR